MKPVRLAAILSLLGFALSCSSPECWLLETFVVERRCPFVEISGSNDRAIKEIATMTAKVPVIFTPQTQQGYYKGRRPCQVTLMTSESGTKLTDAEKQTWGSEENLILYSGNDYHEIDTNSGLEQFIYVEESISGEQWNIHGFCPELNRPGNWKTKIGFWSTQRGGLLQDEYFLALCPLALMGAKITVAYFQSPCRVFKT